jgi:ribosomal-protein-alanine N-acetyltransferase
MMECTIRQMEHSDLTAVQQIERQVYPFPWSNQIFIDCMESGKLLVVVECERRVVGYAVQSTVAGESELLNIVIDPAAQGQGLGRTLLQWLIEQARQQHSEMLFLEVRLSNPVAQRLYESLGFNEIGLRRRYYRVPGGGREDALLYALQLLPEGALESFFQQS